MSLRKRIEKVNFCHVGHEYSKRGCGVARSILAVMLRIFNGRTAVCVCICRDEMEMNCFVLEVRNCNCWNHTVRFPTLLASR